MISKSTKSRYTTTHVDGSYTNYEEVETYTQKIKPGYRRIYMTLIELYEECVSQKETKLVGFILRNTSKMLTMDFTNKQIANAIGASESWVSKGMTKMRKLKLIAGSNGSHRVNPHIFIPYNIKSEIVAEAQHEWTINNQEPTQRTTK